MTKEIRRNFRQDNMGRPSEEATNFIFEWHKEPTKEEETICRGPKGGENPHSLFDCILNSISRLGASLGTQDIEVNTPKSLLLLLIFSLREANKEEARYKKNM